MSKVIISVGGTGGHIIPAKVIADALTTNGIECLFLGAGLNTNPYFNATQYAHKEIVAPPLSLRAPMQSLKVMEGVKQSKKILAEFKPDAVIGFGSYHTVPTLIAAVMRHDPLVLFEANSIPGRAVRLFSSFAKVTTFHIPEAAKNLRGQTLQVHYPLREACRLGNISQKDARAFFGLDSDLPTLLVFGGSQGARGINDLLHRSAALLQKAIFPFQLIHLTGSRTANDRFEILYKRLGIPAFVREYEERIDHAWRASDLCIMRSGAGSIAEQLKMEVPSILIPYPEAKDRHQDKNADFMMWTVGGGIKLLQEKATPELLVQKVRSLLNSETSAHMKRCMQVYKENTQHEDLLQVILSVVGKA